MRAKLPRFKAQTEAGVLLDEIVGVVDGEDWCEPDGAATDVESRRNFPSQCRSYR